MKFTVPNTNISLLSWPSKMSCASWSLPAGGPACPSINGTICNDCYAQKGTYKWPAVENAQQARWYWTKESMRTHKGAASWTAHMLAAIKHEVLESKQPKYFRIHDSGDFFNATYALAWREVAARLPEIKFWAPTRRWQAGCGKKATGAQVTNAGTIFKILTDEDRTLTAIKSLASLPNVTVRPSALDFDQDGPDVEGLAAGSGSITYSTGSSLECPASLNSSSCEEEECRYCWDRPGYEVYYLKH